MGSGLARRRIFGRRLRTELMEPARARSVGSAGREREARPDRADHGRVVLGGIEQVAGVAVQQDGAIVAVGQGEREAVVVRLRPGGTPDPLFGRRVLAGPTGSRTFGYAVAVQRDGKILVAGTTVATAGSGMGLWRLLPSGAPDASFGDRGLASFRLSAFADYAFDLAVDLHGRAVLVGYTGNGDDMIVVRFTSAGTPDPSFNSVGGAGAPYFQIRSGGYAAAYGVAIQPDRPGPRAPSLPRRDALERRLAASDGGV
jgi:uncharacterized delta-60 repeat protein